MFNRSDIIIILDGDYVPGPYTITFKAGNIMAPFNFSIIDDNIFENSENFNLTISSNESIIFGDPSVVLVVILDNDSECNTYIIKCACTVDPH